MAAISSSTRRARSTRARSKPARPSSASARAGRRVSRSFARICAFRRPSALGLELPFSWRSLSIPPLPLPTRSLRRRHASPRISARGEGPPRAIRAPARPRGAAPSREAGVKPVVGRPVASSNSMAAQTASGRAPRSSERREVSGHRGRVPAREVLLQERDRERAPFFRIGRASDLVDEREPARSRLGEHRVERLHRRGERRAAGQDLLRVADLRADRAEDGHARGRTAEERQTRLRHQGEESGGLEHDGLAAGVRTGDDEQAFCAGSSRSSGTTA